MEGAPDFDALVDAIYTAAGAPEAWPKVMSMLADATGALSACLFIWNKRQNTFSLTAPSRRMDPRANALYEAYYGARDAAVVPLAAKPVGEFVLCQQLFSKDYVRRDEFYNDFLIPVGGIRYRAGVRLLEDKDSNVLLAINRSPRDGPFEGAELTALRRIVNHLTKAVALHLRLAKLTARENMFTDVFDRIADGIIVVDGDCRILMMNRAAQALVAAGDGLTMRDGRLGANRSDDACSLHREVASAVKMRASNGRSSGAVTTVRRASAQSALSITIVPLISRMAARMGLPQQAAASLFFAPPDPEPRLSVAQLIQLFGLTAAEARVAAAIAAGMTIDVIAVEHGTTRNTIRNQLRSTFAKTDTNRQAELVRLLSRLGRCSGF
jgi:DNA-binding CsgD family transcriptional regulator/PAS domain-containing protein